MKRSLPPTQRPCVATSGPAMETAARYSLLLVTAKGVSFFVQSHFGAPGAWFGFGYDDGGVIPERMKY